MKSTDQLECLPNIGHTLSQLLHETGINTPEELYQLGAVQSFIRIKAVDLEACFSKLCALEGAVGGIRWPDLQSQRKMN